MSSPSMSITDTESRSPLEPPSPILSLPDELLRAIITIVAEQEPPTCMRVSITPSMPLERTAVLGVLRLSEVCRRFRALLVSMPELWAALFCLLPETHTALVLARACAAPLTAYICDMREWEYSGIPGYYSILVPDYNARRTAGRERLVALVAAHAARLRSLTVRHLNPAQHNRLFSGTLPVLEELEMEYGSENMLGGHTMRPVDAPRLRSAKFHMTGTGSPATAAYRENVAAVSFRFPALRALDITSLRWHAERVHDFVWIADLLASAPLMEDLRLLITPAFNLFRWEDIFGGRGMPLVHLRSFALEGNFMTDLTGLYKHIPVARCSKFALALPVPTVWVNSVAEKRIVDLLDLCGHALQHPSYDGLLLRLRRRQRRGQDHPSSIPYFEITAYPALAEPSRALQLEEEAMPECIFIGIPYYVDEDSPLNRAITNAVSQAWAHNGTRQLAVDVHSFAKDPVVCALVEQICAAAGELIRAKDVAQTGEFLGTMGCPSPDMFLEGPAVWDARQAGS